MDTSYISAMAESAVEAELLSRDIQCWRPTAETQHDLLAYFNGDYQKVQVKHARYREDNGVVDIHTTSWGNESDYDSRRDYDESEVDYFAGYCSELDKLFLVPFEETGSASFWIRVDETTSNHPSINWEENYTVDEVI